jgi:hypothetical protein
MVKNKLVLINDNIPNLANFVSSLNDTVHYLVYNRNDNISTLLSKILGLGILVGNNLDYLAFVFHYNNRYSFLEDTHFFDKNGENILNSKFTNFVSSIIDLYGIETLDFLACDLASDPLWKQYIDQFSKEYSVKVRASTNDTGNLSNGGDWILETSGEDVTQLYFTEKILNWNGLLSVEITNNFNRASCLLTNETSYNAYFTGVPDNNLPVNSLEGVVKIDSTWFATPPTNAKILMVAIGDHHTLLITDEPTNNLYVCGSNKYGATGVGFMYSNETPVSETNYEYTTKFTNLDYNGLPLFPEKRVISISVGLEHSIVLTDELTSNLYVCGNNQYYGTYVYLVSFNNSDYEIPFFSERRVIYATTFNNYSIAITDEPTNNVYVCGFNSTSGRLGLGVSNTENTTNWTNNVLIDYCAKKAVCSHNTTIVLTADNKLFIAGTVNGNTNALTFTEYSNEFVSGSEVAIDIFAGSVSPNNTEQNKYDLLLVLTDDNKVYYLNHLNFLGFPISVLDRPPNPIVFSLIEGTPNNIHSVGVNSEYTWVSSGLDLYYCGSYNGDYKTAFFADEFSNVLVNYQPSHNSSVTSPTYINTLDTNTYIYYSKSSDYNNNTITANKTTNGEFRYNNINDRVINIELVLLPNDIISTKHIPVKILTNKFENVYVTVVDGTHIQLDTSERNYYNYDEGLLTSYLKQNSILSVSEANDSCLCEDTEVLTPNGYMPITLLKVGDLVVSDDNNSYPITSYRKTTHFLNDNSYPYVVTKGSITESYPPNDVNLSKNHLIKFNGKWIAPYQLSSVTRDKTANTIVYYHISLGDYKNKNLVVNGGCVVETMCDTEEDHIEFKRRLLNNF